MCSSKLGPKQLLLESFIIVSVPNVSHTKLIEVVPDPLELSLSLDSHLYLSMIAIIFLNRSYRFSASVPPYVSTSISDPISTIVDSTLASTPASALTPTSSYLSLTPT